MNSFKKYLLLIALLIASACAGNQEKSANTKKEDLAKKSYEKAIEMTQENNFLMAAEKFETVDEDYPFSPYASKSQVMAAYCYYRAGEYNDSIGMIDYFLELNPAHQEAAYMHYLKAMSYYDRVFSIKKNSDNLNQTADALKAVNTRFPESKYGIDAKNKLNEINNYIAAYEMYLGRFYMDTKDYIGAMNRFNNVIISFKDTNQAAEAHYRLMEIYAILDMETEKERVAKIIKTSYSDTKWHTYSQNLKGVSESKLIKSVKIQKNK